HVLELAGLSVAEITELVGDERAATRISASSAGNPLMIAALRASGGAGGPDLGAVVRARVVRLPARARETLHLAALCQHDFELPVLASALGRDQLDVLDDLELATAARLVAETAADTFRFEHALVRAALRDEIAASRRVRMHARLAAAIEDVHALRLDEQLSRLAYHYFEAGTGERTKAIDYLVRAAGSAVEALALDEAEAQYERALGLLPSSAPERIDLLMALGVVRRDAGRNLSAAAAFEQAVHHAEAIGLAREAIEAAVEFEGTTWRSGTPGSTAAQMLSRVGERFAGQLDRSDERLRVRLDASYGRALVFSGRRSEGIQRVRDALERARTFDDDRLLAHVLAASGPVDLSPEHLESQLALVSELGEVADRLGDRDVWMQGATYQLYLLIASGQTDAFRKRLARFAREAEASKHAFFSYVVQNHVAGIAFPVGELDRAESEAERCLELAEQLDDVDPSGIHGLRMFAIRREQDRLGAVGPLLARVLAARPDASLWRPGLALLHAELDQRERAAAAFEALAHDGFRAVPRDSLWPASLGFLAEVCVYLGDRSRAQVLATELAPFSGIPLLGGAFVLNLGPADRYRGLLATCRGELASAAELLRGAVEQGAHAGADLWTAHAAVDLAVVEDARGDSAEARRARDLAEGIVLRHDLARVQRRLHSLAS
ncbi:MAG: hypothetical protein OEY23_23280, partial [Acidimicrobiia bacterium]|nr:hypothetical protein [Acidimicrobiia bacterium]